MNEQDFLKNFAKILGAEQTFEEIEEKQQRERLMLERLSVQFGVPIVEEVVREVPQELVSQLVVEPEPIIEQVVEPEPIVEELVVENVIPIMPQLPVDTIVTKSVEKISKAAPEKIQQAVDEIPGALRREIDSLKKSVADFHRFASRMSQMGGGGEVNLRYLDDVDRASIYSGRYLRYNGVTKKFEFAEVNPHDVVYETVLVTTPTYDCTDQDYYIGVNYAGPVTITLPAVPSSGRGIVIKDESGNCSTNPITVTGTVDNDPGGFILQMDNGGIQLLFRDGWRII